MPQLPLPIVNSIYIDNGIIFLTYELFSIFCDEWWCIIIKTEKSRNEKKTDKKQFRLEPEAMAYFHDTRHFKFKHNNVAMAWVRYRFGLFQEFITCCWFIYMLHPLCTLRLAAARQIDDNGQMLLSSYNEQWNMFSEKFTQMLLVITQQSITFLWVRWKYYYSTMECYAWCRDRKVNVEAPEHTHE